MLVQRSGRLLATAQVAGIDGVQVDGAKTLFQCSNLTESVLRQVAIVMSVEAAVEVALRLSVPDDVYFCHVFRFFLCVGLRGFVTSNWNLCD